MAEHKVTEAEFKQAESLLMKARSKLLVRQPFFGALALRLTPTPVTDTSFCNTAAVDGRNLYYYPPFINSLPTSGSIEKVIGLVAHEVMHCVFNHMTRRNGRDMEDWNIACDYAINSHLIECGFILPDEGIFDTEKKYVNWNSETIYSDIHKDDAKKPPPCGWGMVLDGKDPTAQQVEWEVAVRAAAMTAKAAGKLPGNLGQLVDKLFEPVVDWRSALWNVATRLDNAEYNWSRPNRAYISEDEYLPSMRSESLGEVVFIFDTSGSVHDRATQQFWSEGADVARHLRPSRLIVIQADATVQKVDEIEPDDIDHVKFEIKGRGGTTFAPAIKYAKEHYPDAEIIVYLTDMEGDYGTDPEMPFLWMSISKKWAEPPFGEVIYMAMDEEE